MLALARLGGDGLQVGRLRLHAQAAGADADAWRARRRVEAQLAQVAAAGVGLPSRTLLFVRQLAVPARHAEIALRRLAQQARRPWLEADAVQAEAVLFADETELVACLLRDWLGRCETQRWWWASVLRGTGAARWLQQHAFSRGEVLAPALALLGERGLAVPCVARMTPSEAAAAAAAVARAYALPTAAAAEGGDAAAALRQPTNPGAAASTARTSAFARNTLTSLAPALARRVPELAAAVSLHPEQVRLLALGLAAVRAPAWARTGECAAALAEWLDAALTGAPATTPDAAHAEDSQRVPRMPHGRVSGDDSTAADAPPPSDPATCTVATDRVASARDVPPRPPPGPALAAPDGVPGSWLTASVHRGEFESERPDDEGLPMSAGCAAIVTPELAAHADDAAVREGPPPRRATWPHSSIEPGLRAETRFGGLFYLLNAWIALGVYADFSEPRGSNCALSPWDLMALVGQAWFGDEFADDPLPPLLAQLAGRESGAAPEPETPLPEGWLDAHLAMLCQRLMQALGDPEATLPDTVCRHHARVAATLRHVDVTLSLAELPLAIRVSGLDRDPGWIPAAGRDLRFIFD